jgi:hypothetical protein
MQRIVVVLLSGIFFFSVSIAKAQQASSAPSQADNQFPPSAAQDCSSYIDAARDARQTLERDRRALDMQAVSGVAPEMNAAVPQPIDLQQDLRVLEQRQMESNGCTLAKSGVSVGQDLLSGCMGQSLLNFQMSHDGELEREIPIWQLQGSTAFFYESGMTIDADGAPNAYHPDNTGLDDLANAGSPGNWYGLAKDADGEPFVQGPNDPFPGYYVSATALADRTRPVNDPARYVDASKIPFIVLPGSVARQLGARPGDFAAVFNQRNGKSSFAIFGDVGPPDRIGEGSVALAENLGIRSDARNGGARRGILFLVFPGSGNGRPRPIEEINTESEKLLQSWGATPQLTACTSQEPARPFAGNRNTN